MLSPTTTRGLLIHIPRGADPPANDRRATTPPRTIAKIFVPTGNIGGRSRGQEHVEGGASVRRARREMGGRGAGEAKSEVGSGESG